MKERGIIVLFLVFVLSLCFFLLGCSPAPYGVGLGSRVATLEKQIVLLQTFKATPPNQTFILPEEGAKKTGQILKEINNTGRFYWIGQNEEKEMFWDEKEKIWKYYHPERYIIDSNEKDKVQ